MREVIVQTRIPLVIRLWRSGRNYLAIVDEQRAIRVLGRYLGREATLEFAGVSVRVRGKAGELDATLVIEEGRVEE
jgi:hypothetical protein